MKNLKSPVKEPWSLEVISNFHRDQLEYGRSDMPFSQFKYHLLEHLRLNDVIKNLGQSVLEAEVIQLPVTIIPDSLAA